MPRATPHIAAENGPPPPESLGPTGARLWTQVWTNFDLRDDESTCLEQAALALDRATAARYVTDLEGMLIPGRFGLRMNPAISIERGSLLLYSRLMRQLGLPQGWPEGMLATRPVVVPSPKKGGR